MFLWIIISQCDQQYWTTFMYLQERQMLILAGSSYNSELKFWFFFFLNEVTLCRSWCTTWYWIGSGFQLFIWISRVYSSNKLLIRLHQGSYTLLLCVYVNPHSFYHVNICQRAPPLPLHLSARLQKISRKTTERFSSEPVILIYRLWWLCHHSWLRHFSFLSGQINK